MTFTDTTGHSDVVSIGSNGTYSANLANLANGTLTYVMRVTDPAGNVITVDRTATLGNGSANAPAGTPEYPNLLNGYAVRPSWEVAGVDYYVGVPANAVLSDPSTLSSNPNISVNSSTHRISAYGSGYTISNINFSLDGGWQLILYGSNITVEDCNFAIGSNGNAMLNDNVGGINNTIKYSTFNANGRTDNYNNTDIAILGPVTVEYCLIENASSDLSRCWRLWINGSRYYAEIQFARERRPSIGHTSGLVAAWRWDLHGRCRIQHILSDRCGKRSRHAGYLHGCREQRRFASRREHNLQQHYRHACRCTR